ncbi:EpsG family protein [Lacrimispora sp. 210928-DFI.3.58]|uniref:EpsG family protein n=1 Tax=Lacrimispora sp. 210928-DFI.3.58 TaxID=2883214 RepID=UPI001D08C585|nr:EpsG family protein [Lacrimispora sp. 210928-DFI.3.58]MCB7320746.1 EpsG family protein [Lacrimispora sp. 210928-DFI.3.58]
MAVYIINIAVITVLGLISRVEFRIKEIIISGKRASEFFLCIVFSTIMALRASTVGVDTSPYSRIFTIIGNSQSLTIALEKSSLSAPLYVILCRILFCISRDPQILTIVTALIINIGLFVFIHKNSSYPIFSAFCWVGLTLFYCSMNGNRQCIAAVFVLNSLSHLSRNLKDMKGWILLAVAVNIHSTAIIMLMGVLGIYLVNRVRDTHLIFILSTLISTISGILFRTVVNFFIQMFPRYSIYTNGYSKYSIFKSTGGGRIIILYLFLFCIVCLGVLYEEYQDTKDMMVNKKMLPAVIFCSVFGAFNCKNELINRMLWYYLALFIVFIPNLLYKCRKTQRTLLGAGIIFVLLVYSFLSLRENQNGVVPYVPFWIE